jgi:hypothetical protein
MLDPTLATFPRPLRMSMRSSWCLGVPDERQATGARHIRLQCGVLEGLLALEVGLHVKERRETGKP